MLRNVKEGREVVAITISTALSGTFNFLTEARDQVVKEYPDARLIIVDTLQKVREVGEEKYSYANDYENITKFKEFSDKNGLCILIVHHTRKLESSDSFEMISGTNGLLGAADGAFVMVMKRTDNSATISVVGRDQQDQERHILGRQQDKRVA